MAISGIKKLLISHNLRLPCRANPRTPQLTLLIGKTSTVTSQPKVRSTLVDFDKRRTETDKEWLDNQAHLSNLHAKLSVGKATIKEIQQADQTKACLDSRKSLEESIQASISHSGNQYLEELLTANDSCLNKLSREVGTNILRVMINRRDITAVKNIAKALISSPSQLDYFTETLEQIYQLRLDESLYQDKTPAREMQQQLKQRLQDDQKTLAKYQTNLRDVEHYVNKHLIEMEVPNNSATETQQIRKQSINHLKTLHTGREKYKHAERECIHEHKITACREGEAYKKKWQDFKSHLNDLANGLEYQLDKSTRRKLPRLGLSLYNTDSWFSKGL